MTRKTPKQATPLEDAHDRFSANRFGPERLAFFSDAVFAIAITLLALEIRLPNGEGPLTNAH